MTTVLLLGSHRRQIVAGAHDRQLRVFRVQRGLRGHGVVAWPDREDEAFDHMELGRGSNKQTPTLRVQTREQFWKL